MRIPPTVRTWGAPPAEVIIRQSEAINGDDFESVAWRGMELIDGWLKPKDVGLSNEERALDEELRPRFENRLKNHLAGFVDYLPEISDAKLRQTEAGYVVSAASKTYYQHQDDLEKWFALGYLEVWYFSPYYRDFTIYTSLHQSKRMKDAVFQSPLLPNWELLLEKLFED